jgi:hypothetical protein
MLRRRLRRGRRADSLVVGDGAAVAEAKHIQVRWNPRAQPPSWGVVVDGAWRPASPKWEAEARHRGLARSHLEAVARDSYALHKRLQWHDVALMWVTAVYDGTTPAP